MKAWGSLPGDDPQRDRAETERDYALHQEQHAVAAQMGLSGKGWIVWGAIVIIVALVFFAVLGLALWF